MEENNKAALIGINTSKYDKSIINQQINELKELSFTLEYKILEIFVQNRVKIDPSTYIGKGKIFEIINKCSILEIKVLIFNDELSPSQIKNIQKLCEGKLLILDRTKIILDIFKIHAQSNEAKKQVELATAQYMLPRLTGLWTHLERQVGGVGVRGGPGEKQIEIDRRILRKNITSLKKDLIKIKNQKSIQKQQRKNIYKICIAGYTNAGKSTLMKALTGYSTLIKNQLFATLDTTTKKIRLNKKYDVLISDTVGFLDNLPHDLIASFRSTLSEIEDADLIIKLIDISSDNIQRHIETINETLELLNARDKKSIIVFNKIDKIKNKSIFTQINKKYDNPLLVSSVNNLKINNLINCIVDIIETNMNTYNIKIPYNKSSFIDILYRETNVINIENYDDHIDVEIKVSKKKYDNLLNLINKKNP